MAVARAVPLAIPLRCRTCGLDLSGLPVDRVFACKPCRIAMEITKSGPQWRNYAGVKPVLPGNQWIYLPFWAFTVDYSIHTDDEGKQPRFEQVKTIGTVYVMGFSAVRVAVFGDVGLQLTGRQPEIVLEDKGTILGCTVGSESAHGYIEPFILSLLDRKADVTDVVVTIRTKQVRLLAMPFEDRNDHLVDGVAGLKLFSAGMNDLNLLRQAATAL